jgi:hypothetical protein
MRKWLVVYVEEGSSEPLYFSSAKDRDNPVWAGSAKFVTDDGGVVTTGVEPIHFEKADAETLAFNFVMYDKRYLDRVNAVECPLTDCRECGTS